MRLIVRGDDAGICVGVNTALIETIEAGVVRNVSVMVPAPAFLDAARRLRDRPGIDVGIHLTLTSEWTRPRWGPVRPAAEVPTLVDGAGHFRPDPQALHDRGFALDEAVAEARAQIAAARAAGLRPAYLDEHMGVGWLPGLRDALADLAHEAGLVAAERIPYLPPVPGQDGPDAILHRIRAAGPGTYAVFAHPGRDEPELRAMHLAAGRPGEVARERDAERRVLIGPRIREVLDRAGATVIRYSAAGESSQRPPAAL